MGRHAELQASCLLVPQSGQKREWKCNDESWAGLWQSESVEKNGHKALYRYKVGLKMGNANEIN